MFPISKNLLIGFVVISLVIIFAFVSDEDNIDYDYSGIVHDISESKNGFTFFIDTEDGSIHCYHSEKMNDLGHYRIKGSFSEDGKIFFVEWLQLVAD